MSKGTQLVNEVTQVTKDAEAGIFTHGVDPVSKPDAPAQTTAAYPRGGLGARDSRDEMVAMKSQFMDPATGVSQFGVVQATDQDFKWLQKKREAAEFANLDAWIGHNFHKADVTQRKWLQETYPEYYESRERLMVERAKLALRIKLLQLRGPKNEKDLILQWGLQTGRIKLDDGWDKIGMSFQGTMDAANLKLEQTRFQNGLFSINRYKGDAQRKADATTTFKMAAANPFLPSTDAANQVPSPFAGPGVDPNGRYPSFLANVLSPYLGI